MLERRWDRIDSEDYRCNYEDRSNKDNWPNGHPEGEGQEEISKETPTKRICIWNRQDTYFTAYTGNK